MQRWIKLKILFFQICKNKFLVIKNQLLATGFLLATMERKVIRNHHNYIGQLDLSLFFGFVQSQSL